MEEHFVRSLSRWFAILVFTVPMFSAAATWYVESDGSGNFPTIQEAVDAAAPGDTIQLGAGLFDYFFTHPDFYYDMYVFISTDNLTLRGAGIDQTVIGQIEEDVHSRQVYAIKVADGLTLQIEDLTIQLKDWFSSTLMRCGDDCIISTKRCGFRDAQNGLHTRCEMVEVVDCIFDGMVGTALTVFNNQRSAVRNSRFENSDLGMYLGGPEILTIEECVFDGSSIGGSTGIYCEYQSRPDVLRCVFWEHSHIAIIASGDALHLYDCEVTTTTGVGILASSGVIGGTGNIVYSESKTLVWSFASTNDFRNNHFLVGGDGYLVYVYRHWSPPITVDLEFNWWGMEDADEISDLVHDHVDDSTLGTIIDYVPFLGGSVSVESRTWSDVKSIFRASNP